MPDPLVLALLAIVVLISATLQGAAGFGFGLLALPAAMMILGSTDAVPLVIALNLTICGGLALEIREDAHRGLLIHMLLGALVGFPAGLLVFQRADPDALMLVVALLVLAFGVILAIRSTRTSMDPNPEPTFRSGSALGVGAVGGAMTTALGAPGPPVILYLAALAVPKDTLRATGMTFFAMAYVPSLLLQAVVVGVERSVWTAIVVLIPVAMVGGWMGNRLAERIDETVFQRTTIALICLTGLIALAGALSR